jgi:hypothetical protein
MLVITHKYTIIHRRAVKKTAQFDKLIAMLLPTLVARFAHELYCALSVHNLVVNLCLLCSKLSAVWSPNLTANP